MLHRTLRKKAEELRLALEVNRIAGQRFDALTGELNHLKEKNETLEERVQQLEESIRMVIDGAQQAIQRIPEGTGALSPDWSEWELAEVLSDPRSSGQ